ncbi:MAG: mechanosensitive ion channel family protein [Porticoccaceae bacterium]|nr:mechanosensitive ion channel family protein [Porticoccaceae bacterium]
MLEQFESHFQQYWIFWVFGIIFAVALINLAVGRLFKLLLKRAESTKNLWDDALILALNRPVEWAVWLFGLNFAALVTAQLTGVEWLEFLSKVNQIGLIVLIAWSLLRFLKRAERNVTSPDHLRKPMDLSTALAIGKLLQASIILTAVLVILQTLGYSISGVLAFGGIGGIAIGFAARDMLANFFGAFMIYLDKPFSVGDWIRSPDQEIEGTVEDIGWRRTVIRTFDKRPLYVPNATFSTISVENPSRMVNRRIYETIGLRYDDVATVEQIVSEVKKMLKQHDEIDTNQTMIVNFNAFGPSSLDFFIYTFTKTTDWIYFHEVKQDVLLKVAKIIADAGAEIAYPTQTLHLAEGEYPKLPQSPIESAQ